MINTRQIRAWVEYKKRKKPREGDGEAIFININDTTPQQWSIIVRVVQKDSLYDISLYTNSEYDISEISSTG